MTVSEISYLESAPIQAKGSPYEKLCTGQYERYLLPEDPTREGLSAYRAVGGYLGLVRALQETPERIIAEIEAAGLTGKGGAGFPTARKWALVKAEPAAARCVIVNGGEHEPGSCKDTVLLARAPHRVIEGAVLAAWAVGAHTVHVLVAEDREYALWSVRHAISEALAAGIIGHRILQSEFSVCVNVLPIPASYVAGEETAAVRFLEEGIAMPKEKPPYPAQAGWLGMPTVVNNVETLASAAAIWTHGAEWYQGLGLPGSPGNALVTLGPEVKRSGVYEVPFGITFRQLVEVCGGGTLGGREVLAFLPGGASLPYLPGRALDLPIDHQGVRSAGSGLGCASVHLVLEGDSLAEDALTMAQFFAGAQCGQCPACRMATNAYVKALQGLCAGGAADAAAGQIEKVVNYAAEKGKCKCALPRMAAAAALSAAQIVALGVPSRA